MRLNSLLVLNALAELAFAAALPVPIATIQGSQVISGALDGNVETFKGIPFAEPPIDDLRFKKPVEYSGTYDGLQANNFRNSCIQLDPGSMLKTLDNLVGFLDLLPEFASAAIDNTVKDTFYMSEDCLYLNVFRPKGTQYTDKLPVMVWIYPVQATLVRHLSRNPSRWANP